MKCIVFLRSYSKKNLTRNRKKRTCIVVFFFTPCKQLAVCEMNNLLWSMWCLLKKKKPLHRHILLHWLESNITSMQAAVGDSTKFGYSCNPLTDFSHDYNPMLALGHLLLPFVLEILFKKCNMQIHSQQLGWSAQYPNLRPNSCSAFYEAMW